MFNISIENISREKVFLLIVLIGCLDFYSIIKDELQLNLSYSIQNNSFFELLNITVNNNTILLFEPYDCHNECTPGFCKYFIDIGYKVDILIHESGIDSFSLFKENKKIRLFTFNSLKQIKKNIQNLSRIIKKYCLILLQSADIHTKQLFINLDLLKLNNSIFVFHEIRFANNFFSNYINNNRIWTLGNMSKGLQVNPHYFGDIKVRDKNNKVRFFLTSTNYRNYTSLIESATKLKSENYNFELIIAGRSKAFNLNQIDNNLRRNIIFKYEVSYSELYKAVISSDFIIIPLDPKNVNDNLYRTTKVTGSIQLVYGFLKPALIHQDFANFYYLNNESSFIYNNSNLYSIMKRAILLSNEDYKIIQKNLYNIEKYVSKISMNNIKKVINSI